MAGILEVYLPNMLRASVLGKGNARLVEMV
jgi:hypothetical protein